MTAFEISSSQAPASGGDQASRLREMFRRHPAEPRDAASAPVTTPIIAITSGKGGVGKTNIAVNLATLLGRQYRITLVDADLGMANADILCGVSPHKRLQHALPTNDGSLHGRMGAHNCTGADLASIGLETPHGFTLVPGAVGVARMADLSASEQRLLLRGLAALETKSRALILDTGAGISSGVLSFLSVADLILVVATPEPTSIADAYALIKCLSQRDLSVSPISLTGKPRARMALVVNQARDQAEAERVHGRIARVCREFLSLSLPLGGWIPRDPQLIEAVMAQTPVVIHAPRTHATAAFKRLAEHLERNWIAQTLSNKAITKEHSASPSRFGILRRLWAGSGLTR